MSTLGTSSLLLLLAFSIALSTSSSPPKEREAILLALHALTLAKTRASAFAGLAKEARNFGPWADCAQLYRNSEARVRLLAADGADYDPADARAWLSGALSGHGTCVDGLREGNVSAPDWRWRRRHAEVEALLRGALTALPAGGSSCEFAWIIGVFFNTWTGLGSDVWTNAD